MGVSRFSVDLVSTDQSLAFYHTLDFVEVDAVELFLLLVAHIKLVPFGGTVDSMGTVKHVCDLFLLFGGLFD